MHYVTYLSKEEQARIKLYLNYDMTASPNHIYGIFHGKESTYNVSWPQGPADIQKLFQHLFVLRGPNHTTLAFTSRSDYKPFIDAGISAGSIDTGAERKKTKKVETLGGQAGVAYDINYRGPGDNVTNSNTAAFFVVSQAIPHEVDIFGRSSGGIKLNETVTEDEEADEDEEDEDEDGDEKEKNNRRHPRRTTMQYFRGAAPMVPQDRRGSGRRTRATKNVVIEFAKDAQIN